MATLGTVNTKDLEFLLQLDRKLHGTQKFTFTPNMGGSPFECEADTYTKASMNAKEIQRVLRIVGRSDFVFYPINTAGGFAVGFRVTNPETREALLTFKEKQLPRNYGFDRLSEFFMRPENIGRAEASGISIVDDRDYYDY